MFTATVTASSNTIPRNTPNKAPSKRSAGRKPAALTSFRMSVASSPAAKTDAIKVNTKATPNFMAADKVDKGSKSATQGASHCAAKKAATQPSTDSTSNTRPRHAPSSKEGKRTRVRVGPFANKAEADQAALKIKALDLPATILSL